MIVDGPIPERVLTRAAPATIFCVMLTVGLGIVVREVRRVGRRPERLARALFAVLVAVPTLALLVVRSLALPRAAQLGIVLMAICTRRAGRAASVIGRRRPPRVCARAADPGGAVGRKRDDATR
jgi:predicted Na+-dependent transporter